MAKDMTGVYGPVGWVTNKALIGETITFDYDGQTITTTVRKDSRGGAYCQFKVNGQHLSKCPLKLLSGVGLDEAYKSFQVLYHPERDVYAFAKNVCYISGNVLEDDNYVPSNNGNSRFYNKDAKAAHMKAARLIHCNKNNKESVDITELARKIYNSKDEDGNYRCHVSGVVMALKDLNADHCHCTGEYMGLVTPEVNVIEGQLKKLLAYKGLEFTHEERLDLIIGMLQGAEKMHNKRLMEIWENIVTSKERKKTSTQQLTPMQLSLGL